MPREFAPGRVKFAALSGTCKRGSSVAEGNCPLGRKMLLPIWQRNGISAVGVPVQYCEGWPVAPQPTVYGVPAKIEPLPLRCPLVSGAGAVGLTMRMRLLDAQSDVERWNSGDVDLSALAKTGNRVIPVALKLPVAGLPAGSYRARSEEHTSELQ